MKFVSVALAVLLTVLLPAGCGKGKANKEHLSADGQKLAEVEVQVNQVTTTAKTPKGYPVRVYEVTVKNQKPDAAGTAIKDQKHVVVVVGDPAIPVEIPNARFVIVGGKKAQLNLASAMAGSYMVPVADPVCGYRQLSVPPEGILAMAKTNQAIAVPVIDQVVDSLAKK
jgi:hypothetical protein